MIVVCGVFSVFLVYLSGVLFWLSHIRIKVPFAGLAHARIIRGLIYPELPEQSIAQATGVGEA